MLGDHAVVVAMSSMLHLERIDIRGAVSWWRDSAACISCGMRGGTYDLSDLSGRTRILGMCALVWDATRSQ